MYEKDFYILIVFVFGLFYWTCYGSDNEDIIPPDIDVAWLKAQETF